MAWYDFLYNLAKDVSFNRYPIKVALHADSLHKPTVVIRITNKTGSLNVLVHKVEVHLKKNEHTA
jgi:hypothetical protein